MGEADFTARLRAVQRKQQAFDDEHDDDAVEVEGHKPLIPDGPYLARYIAHETALLFGKRAHKIFLRFEICEGEYQGVQVVRPFRARQVVGRTGRGGKFKLNAGGDLYRTLARLLDVKTRPDRISLAPLKHMLFRIHTRTVGKDWEDRELAEGTRYSIVDSIEDGR